MTPCIPRFPAYKLPLLMDEKNKPLTIDLQALAPAPLKSRLTELRRYL